MVWDCQAYGRGGEAVGALCFFAEPGTRSCRTEGECHAHLAAERVRVFDRIGEMAAAGNPVGLYLASEFTAPEQLLGGLQSPPEEEEE